MRITVQVKPNASFNRVEQVEDGLYKVFTTATPERGKANEATLKQLSAFLHIPVSSLVIRFGKTAREKIIEILD